jgi:hypothetical protein
MESAMTRQKKLTRRSEKKIRLCALETTPSNALRPEGFIIALTPVLNDRNC